MSQVRLPTTPKSNVKSLWPGDKFLENALYEEEFLPRLGLFFTVGTKPFGYLIDTTYRPGGRFVNKNFPSFFVVCGLTNLP